jgi:hypothetical protein
MSTDLKPGHEYSCRYPFVVKTVMLRDEEGSAEVESWCPGTIEVFRMPDDSDTIAHALGRMILTVVSVHRPGRYPERVFYTRQWEDPDGKVFGRNNLRVTTTGNFGRLIRGYRHPYALAKTDK